MAAPDRDTSLVRRHSPLDDGQGLFIGTVMVAFGLGLLQHLGLVTGQIAGLALLVSTWTGVPFGPVDSFSVAEYREAVDANLLPHISLTLAALPFLRSGGRTVHPG